MLRDQITEIDVMHVRPFNQMIEVLQYLEQQRRVMSLMKRRALNILMKQLQRDLQQDLDQYFIYPLEQRHQYQSELNVMPTIWLKTQIEKHTQQLIENTNFVYERDLNAFKDHQKFIDQKFTPVEDFKTISLHPYNISSAGKNNLKINEE